MFLYKAKEPGFYEGKLYSPEGKRPVLKLKDKLKNVPTWLELVEGGVKNKRGAKKQKDEQDRKEIEGASFLDGENKPTVKVL